MKKRGNEEGKHFMGLSSVRWPSIYQLSMGHNNQVPRIQDTNWKKRLNVYAKHTQNWIREEGKRTQQKNSQGKGYSF